uniref:Uncharacterized protein n=1 Tax=Romanomermis culicivorax TaxID=13658 RepID=A0A915I932_ROMCU
MFVKKSIRLEEKELFKNLQFNSKICIGIVFDKDTKTAFLGKSRGLRNAQYQWPKAPPKTI